MAWAGMQERERDLPALMESRGRSRECAPWDSGGPMEQPAAGTVGSKPSEISTTCKFGVVIIHGLA